LSKVRILETGVKVNISPFTLPDGQAPPVNAIRRIMAMHLRHVMNASRSFPTLNLKFT
jgi:hypothetical protein